MGSTLVCYPMDVLKFRMQMSGEGGRKKEHATTLHVARSIFRKEGVSGFYSGLSASLLRQLTYTGVRLGVYQAMLDYLSRG